MNRLFRLPLPISMPMILVLVWFTGDYRTAGASEVLEIFGNNPGWTWCYVNGMSPDGGTIVGVFDVNDQHGSFVWTDSTGAVLLPGSIGSGGALGTTDSMRTIVGSELWNGAVGWTPEEGYFAYGGGMGSEARVISGDGRIAAGCFYVGTDTLNNPLWVPCRWKDRGPTEFLRPVEDPPAGTLAGYGSRVYAISTDGSTIVGEVGAATYGYPFKWTESTRMVFLASYGLARGVSKTGKFIVGAFSGMAGVYTDSTGWVPLPGGNGALPSGVSSDGAVIVSAASLWLRDPVTREYEHHGLETYVRNVLGVELPAGYHFSAQLPALSDDGRYVAGNIYRSPDGGLLASHLGYRLDLQPMHIITPDSMQLFVSGRVNLDDGENLFAAWPDTIRWTSHDVDQVDIWYSTDNGASWDTVVTALDTPTPPTIHEYPWYVPVDLLSRKCRIRIEAIAGAAVADTSEVFRIKGYDLTRLDPIEPGDPAYVAPGDSVYVAWDWDKDRWGFGNDYAAVWPPTWWTRFDYNGDDPLTLQPYPHNFFPGFAEVFECDYPDWPAFVDAFSTPACYLDVSRARYSYRALCVWFGNLTPNCWVGSCVGIAASNALAFSYRDAFTARYPSYPAFSDPIQISAPTAGGIPVISELFAKQYGSECLTARFYKKDISVNETLEEMLRMLQDDVVDIKVLTFRFGFGRSGWHAVNLFKVRQDPADQSIFRVSIWDNEHPDDGYPNATAPMILDTNANSGMGAWYHDNYPTCDGSRGLLLDIPARMYLDYATLPNSLGSGSPKADGEFVDIRFGGLADVLITDNAGHTAGYFDGLLVEDIPSVLPLISIAGSIAPPYGFRLPAGNYSVNVSAMTMDHVTVSVDAGEQLFLYSRLDAAAGQTDVLDYAGSFTVANPDAETKTYSLVSNVHGSSEEHTAIIGDLNMVPNGSVSLATPGEGLVRLTTNGNAVSFDLALDYSSASRHDRFATHALTLPADASHTYVPDWDNLATADLTILVDLGNDGTVDDTLRVANGISGVPDDLPLPLPLPTGLGQNHPNPFNGSTVIEYALVRESHVTLKVYGVDGALVATLVDGMKGPGLHSVEFDSGDLPSGVYFCRMEAGGVVQTRKMVLVK